MSHPLDTAWAHLLTHVAQPTQPDLSTLHQRAEDYWHVLAKWNAKIKLTGAKTLADFAYRHWLDSLMGIAALGPLPPSANLLDVGAGAGFPGYPLALYYPETQWTLVETHQRRSAFLQQVKRTVSCENVTVKAVRITGAPAEEGLQEDYSHLLFRAVAPEQILPIAHHYLAKEGQVVYWGTQEQSPDCPPTLEETLRFPYTLPDGESFCLYRYSLSSAA
jgi:16S rRNA (guanine(527)-N(7))-methyltransferase RsmG